MEFTKETIEEFENILHKSVDDARKKVEYKNMFEKHKEFEILKSYLANLEEQLKVNIEEKNQWKNKAIKLQAR